MDNISLLQRLANGNFRKDILGKALLLRDKGQEKLFELARKKRTEYFPSGYVEVRSVIEISNICKRRCNFCNINSYSKRKDILLKRAIKYYLCQFVLPRFEMKYVIVGVGGSILRSKKITLCITKDFYQRKNKCLLA